MQKQKPELLTKITGPIVPDLAKFDLANESRGGVSGSPLLTEVKHVIRDPKATRLLDHILTELSHQRQESPNTQRQVNITTRTVEIPTSNIGETDLDNYIEIDYEIPEGIVVDSALLNRLREFYAREVCDKGASENRSLRFVAARKWDYDPQDKLATKIISKRGGKTESGLETESDMDGTSYTVVKKDSVYSEPGKAARRRDRKTGSTVFIGQTSILSLDNAGTIKYFYPNASENDDMTACQGIFIHQGRPVNARNYRRPFSSIPLNLDKYKPTTKVTLRISRRDDISELETYYTALMLGDILSGRINYDLTETDRVTVGANYKDDLIAITAYLNSQRLKSANLKELPGLQDQVEILENFLLKPLRQNRPDLASNIIFSGAPGTGKTFLTAALAQENCGVAFVSLPAKAVLEGWDSISRTFDRLYNKFGINICIIVQDAEFLFANDVREEGRGGQADKREAILNIINGETNNPYKFVLTLNKPEVLDEAARRRFVMVHVPVPSKEKPDILHHVARVSLQSLDIQGLLPPELVDTMIDMVSAQSIGYTPDFTASLVRLVLSMDGITAETIAEKVEYCAEKLKNGYPIDGIMANDKSSARISAQSKRTTLGFIK